MKDIFANRQWQPMLLEEKEKPIDSENYLCEIKFDGQRAIVFVDKDEVTIQNRHFRDITYLFPELQELKKISKKKVVFDGEIVSFKDGKPSFQKLQERTHLQDKDKIKIQSKENPVVFIVFDILYEDGNLITLPLIKRKGILNRYPDTEVFVKNIYMIGKGKYLFAKVKKMNLEGIVQKKIDSLYYPNERVAFWFKVKNLKEEVFVIMGYIEKEESRVVSLVLGENIKSTFHYVGRVVMSKKNILYQKLLGCQVVKKVDKTIDIENVKLIEPKYKCLVKYSERTNNFHLRQPVFIKEVE